MIALNNPNLLEAVPSIFADRPHPKTSPEYQFVRTDSVLELLESKGWQIQSARQQKVKNTTERQYAKHTVTLRRPSDSSIAGVFPTIKVVNSHNWASLFQLYVGMFRLVCSNGLMVGHDLAKWAIRHDRIQEDISAVLDRFGSIATLMFREIDNWNGIDLSRDQRQQFAIGAARLRFHDAEGSALESLAENMLVPRRAADTGDSLWQVYNRLQENGMVGGFRLQRRIARPIQNIQSELDFNLGLHRLASEFAPSLN